MDGIPDGGSENKRMIGMIQSKKIQSESEHKSKPARTTARFQGIESPKFGRKALRAAAEAAGNSTQKTYKQDDYSSEMEWQL